MKTGIIGGTSLYRVEFLKNSVEEEIKTGYGDVYAVRSGNVIFIPRHGKDNNIPPHMINHKANIMAFRNQGVRKIIGISSVGSLKKNIPPASILVPQDYINFCNNQSYHDNEMWLRQSLRHVSARMRAIGSHWAKTEPKVLIREPEGFSHIVHITPGLDDEIRNLIIQTAKKLRIKIIEKGVYFQTSGPRLETKAEINLIKNYADVVGMTMASEATLAKELDLGYACICSVDNYCNGIVDEKLDFRKVVKKASNDRGNLIRLLTGVIEGLQDG